jgi:pimeloyl-ACP methyl ester carboxylesterase
MKNILLALSFTVCAVTAGVTQQASAAPLIPEQGIGTQVVTIGGGTTWVRYLLLAPLPSYAPYRPTTAVMLFAGGNGLLGLTPEGIITTSLAGNFLVRSRTLFAQHNLLVAVVDAPGALPASEATRWSEDYARIMTDVIGDLRSRTPVQKIWLIGTSSGTLSAASIAGLYPRYTTLPPLSPRVVPNASRPDGVVLTASQTDVGQTSGTTCTATIFDQPLRLPSINVPVYVAADRDDACPCSPPARSNTILKSLQMAPARAGDVFPLDGSPSPPGPGTNACSANTPHGFYGIEADVVARVVDWVNAH